MNAQTEARFDAASVYREEQYTDRRVGTIRVLVPTTADGAPDGARPTLYVGQISVMTPMGTLPISFEIEAKTLSEAIGKFGDAARIAMDDAMRELQQLRREAASASGRKQIHHLPPGRVFAVEAAKIHVLRSDHAAPQRIKVVIVVHIRRELQAADLRKSGLPRLSAGGRIFDFQAELQRFRVNGNGELRAQFRLRQRERNLNGSR